MSPNIIDIKPNNDKNLKIIISLAIIFVKSV